MQSKHLSRMIGSIERSSKRLILAALTISLLHTFAYAQNNGQPNAYNNASSGSPTSVKINGTFHGTDGKILQVMQDDGTPLLVAVPRDQKNIEYRVELTPKQLQPGMFVRFQTNYESLQSGEIVPEGLELFTSEDQKKINPRDPASRFDFVPGIYSFAEYGHDPNSREFRVVGQINGFKDNSLVVNAGRAIQVPVKEDAVFVYRTSSMTLVKRGDGVEGNGITYNPQSNQVIANRIAIIGKMPEVSEDTNAKASDMKASKSKKRRSKKEDAEMDSADKVDEAVVESAK